MLQALIPSLSTCQQRGILCFNCLIELYLNQEAHDREDDCCCSFCLSKIVVEIWQEDAKGKSNTILKFVEERMVNTLNVSTYVYIART